MKYKTIIINGVEYEMHPHINDYEDCNHCYFDKTEYCEETYVCIEEDCYFIPKEL